MLSPGRSRRSSPINRISYFTHYTSAFAILYINLYSLAWPQQAQQPAEQAADGVGGTRKRGAGLEAGGGLRSV
jgi:hypothetical protein